MMHTTYDGRQVDGNSEEWRAHCEATTLLRMSLHDRRIRLQGVMAKRGPDAHRELSELVRTIWIHRQVKALEQMHAGERQDYLAKIERATESRTRGDIERILNHLSTADLFEGEAA